MCSLAISGVDGGELQLIRRVVESPAGCYFTYPHANGFLPDGHSMIVARPESLPPSGGSNEKTVTRFLRFDPETGETTEVGALAGVKMYYGISETGMLVANVHNSLVIMDTALGAPSARVLWESEAPWRLSDLPDISPDGREVLVDFHDYTPPGRHQARVFDTQKTGTAGRVLLEKPWLLNHTHRSPADRDWFLFSHEGMLVTDRMWAWHPAIAPQGRAIFDQIAPDGQALYVGHELAMHHKPAALAVAFGNSPGAPRGLYEVDFTGKARPLAPGARDWHCNISRDGRWAVVDTMGASDDPGPIRPGWADHGGVSDVVAVNLTTGARQLLHRGSFLRSHPWHPHPHISPDGRWVVYNDAQTRRVRALEIDPIALKVFVEGKAEMPPSDVR